MILYRVYAGVIKAQLVVRETKCGWREINGGFINRKVMRSSPSPSSLSTDYYTTSEDEAIMWSKSLIEYMHELQEISHASISNINAWSEDGKNKDLMPDSRLY